MAIDSPLDAAEEQIAAEKRTESGLAVYGRDVSEILGAFPTGVFPPGMGLAVETLKFSFKAVALYLRKTEDRRRRYLSETVVDELRWLQGKLTAIEAEHRRFINEEFPGLVLHALQRAERTRAQSRIKRMGKVLGTSARRGPDLPADEVEELLRLSTDLDDADLRVLGALVAGQRHLLAPATGMVTLGQVNKYWQALGRKSDDSLRSEFAQTVELTDGELHSAFAKLSAYGLLVQRERDESKLPRDVVVYAILPRAVAFVDALGGNQPGEDDLDSRQPRDSPGAA
jgi:hypothetical protein